MTIQEKFQPVLILANELGVKITKASPEGSGFKVEAIAKTGYEKDLILAKIKEVGGAEAAFIKTDIKTELTDCYHIHVVMSGDTLSGIAKKYLDNAGKYMDIAKFNNISNPDVIKVGQKIKIPNK
jgi:nucleoid-associated protein YgaU